MAYFPHNEEDEFDNPRKNRFEDNYPVSRSRNYSPEDKDRITQRIIRYFEDPKEAKALAEIKRISMKAKKSSNNLRMDLGDFKVTDDLKNNTELNKVMFKQEGDKIELEQPNVTEPFTRRKFKFSTQRYVPKSKNMTLIDEIREKENKSKNLKNKVKYEKKEEKKEYKPKREIKKIRFSVDNNKDNSVQDKNNNNNNSINYNSHTSNLKKPTNSHASNLKKMRKLNTDNVFRTRYNERKPDYRLRNDETKRIEIIEGSFSSLPDEYKTKNNATVENIHNKEKIIINEYLTKDRDRAKNFKTEYLWDKSIKRLVEKRTYLDKDEIADNNDNKYNNNSVTYRNRYKFNDENDTKDKRDIEPKNDKKEEKRKINLKYNISKDKNNKEYDNIIEDRKRFGRNTIPLEKDNKSNTIDKNNNRDDEEISNKTKEVNKNNRFYRRYKYHIIEDKAEEKPLKEEKVIDKKKVNEKEDTPEKVKQEEVSKPYRKVYQKREKFLTIDPETNINIDDNENNIPEASPGKEKEKEKEKEIENDNKFSRRPYVKPRDTRPKAFYTKKIILEEVIPRKKEVIPEKKKYEKKEKIPDLPIELEEDKVFEKKEAKVPKIKPYTKYNNNIRLKIRSDNLDNKEDKEKIKNTPYNNYMKNKRKINEKKAFRNAKTKSELIDDLAKIENYNINTYLKNDLLEIYDNINEEFNDFKKDIFYTNINSFEVNMGDFDKKNMPYTKKTRPADDLYKGRVTTDDMYKKYSQKAKKYEKKKLFE